MKAEAKQVKSGIILSYLLIILNTAYGLFMTPYIVRCIGGSEYGVYKTIAALSSSLMILDMGIGSTAMRFTAKYRAVGNEKDVPNLFSMMLIQCAVLCTVFFIVCGGVFFLIKPVFSASFTVSEVKKAQMLFAVLLFNMLLHIIENVFNGIITGCGKFLFGNGVKVIRLLFRIALTAVMLKFISDSLVLVLIDLSLTVIFLAAEIFYTFKVLKIIPKYMRWDRSLFAETSKYTVLMFLTSIAAQVNNNLDNVIIGAVSGSALVTVYSMGLLIFSMYENLSTAVSGVMLPTVTDLLENDSDGVKIQKLIIKVGRIQFMLLGAAAVGFACIGKDFINVWLGKGYEDVYIITLILMLPSLFELCVNVCLSILRAKNMLGFRTAVLFLSTIMNAGITVLAVKYWSYIGAALGTAASFIIGSLLVMNLYYYKKLNLPMLKIYRGIVSRTWLCLAAAGLALLLSSKFIKGGIRALIINILIFCVVYGIALLVFGFTPEEKSRLLLFKSKVKRKESLKGN